MLLLYRFLVLDSLGGIFGTLWQDGVLAWDYSAAFGVGIAPCGMTRILAQPLALLCIELLSTIFGCFHALEDMNDALPIVFHT